LSPQPTELDENALEVDSQLAVELFVSNLFDADVGTDGDAQRGLLCDLVDVFQDLDYLRHDGDLLDDLLKQVGHLDDPFDGGIDGHDLFLVAIDHLHLGLDVVVGILLDDELVLLDDPIAVDHDLLDLGVALVDGHDLLLEGGHLLDLLVDDGDLDGSLADGLDDLVDVHDHRHLHGQLDEIGHRHDLLKETFDFVDPGDFVVDSDDSLDDGGHFPDGLLDLGDGLGDPGLDFLDGFVVVGDDLLDLLDHLADDGLLDDVDHLLDAHLLTAHLDDLLYLLDDLHDLFNFSVDGHNLLDDPVHWDGDFDGHDGGLLDFDHLLHLDDLGDDALD
jgi:hypothetical protein